MPARTPRRAPRRSTRNSSRGRSGWLRRLRQHSWKCRSDGRLHHFTVLTEIEADLLLLVGYAERDDQVGELVKQVRTGERERGDKDEREAVDEERPRRSRHQAAVLREDAGHEHPDHAAAAVTGKNVESVVEPPL